MASNVKRFIDTYLDKIFVCLFVGLFLFNVKPVHAKNIKDEVIKVIPPFEISLKKTGPVRLAGILYDASSTALSQFIKVGDQVSLSHLTETPDRYGRKAAHVYLQDHRWLQGELVRVKSATPYPYENEHHLIRDLYQLEKPDALPALNENLPLDQFAIIEGVIVGVAEIKGQTYLNFGDNWRTDFTIKIEKKNLKSFLKAGLKLSDLKGEKIRIRGWVINQNGPMIEVRHPSQLEILKD